MNISRENRDEVNVTLTLKVEKEDYENKVNEVLNDYRKKARIDGFRPGKVPFGLVNKLYRRPVMIEEINKLVSESLAKYITDEKLHVLGEPLPNEEKQSPIDFENQDSFEFIFDLGIAPAIDLEISSKIKIPYYEIKLDKKITTDYIDNLKQRFGQFQPVEAVTENEMLTGKLVEIEENGNVPDKALIVDDAKISLEVIKDNKIKSKFIAAKAGDVVDFNLKGALPNDTELSSLLKIDKSRLADISNFFRYEIKEVAEFKKAELNQNLFDMVYGKDIVKSEEEFMNKLKEDIKVSLASDGNYRFSIDAKNVLLSKAGIKLPVDFLKKWLLFANEGKVTKEQVDKEFDSFEEDLKWQLVKGKISKDNNITVDDQELLDFAKNYAYMQFRQYGMGNVPEEQVELYAKSILEKEDQSRNLHERKLEEKIISFVKESVKIDKKEITSEKFNKLFEE